MRMLWALVVIAGAVLVVGCPRPQTQEPARGPDVVQEPAGETQEPAEAESVGEDVTLPSEQDLPECPASEFGDPDSEVTLQTYVDLDMDGTEECIIGFQARTRDEVGEPVAPAYLELAKWDGSEWTGWFGVPAPDGETFVDEDSIAIADDINADGTLEFGVQFYTFGVSSRRENLYLWQVIDGGLEPAIAGGVIESTSDDGLVVEDVDASFPGSEIVIARAIMGEEAHAAPHRYEITEYAWSGGTYLLVDTIATQGTSEDPFAAIESVME